MKVRSPQDTGTGRRTVRIPVASLLMGISLAAPAALAEEAIVERANTTQIDRALEVAKGHPNERWRAHGIKAYNSGHPDEAVQYFERAARYADKYSQHRLSLLYWDGEGVAKNRVQAYIWSDLAAERGNRRFLAIREKMWAQLGAEERAQIEAEGPDYYSRYGDDVGKPKLAKEMKRFARNMTGSRVGYDNSQRSVIGGGPAMGSFKGTPAQVQSSLAVAGFYSNEEMYGEGRVDPERYWQTQDVLHEPGKGQVDVGELEATDDRD